MKSVFNLLSKCIWEPHFLHITFWDNSLEALLSLVPIIKEKILRIASPKVIPITNTSNYIGVIQNKRKLPRDGSFLLMT
jgi:hypothetical protein